MKTLTLTLVLMFGITTFSFAGNQPAQIYPAGIVVANTGNRVCPVMNHQITSKHNFEIALSNGKHMTVCCSPCKETVEKDLGKYQALMY